MKSSILTRCAAAAAVAVASLVAIPATSAPASATPAGDNVVINEIYNNGGSSGASFANRYFELYNPTAKDISVNGWSLQYKSSAGAAFLTANTPLGDKHLEPGGTLVVQGASNNAATNPGATLAFDVAGTLNSAGAAGVVALSKSTAQLTTSLTDMNLVDLVGYGTAANLFEGTRAPTGGLNLAITRKVAGKDSDDNGADFTTAAPTPTACGTACDGPGDGGGTTPEEPGTPVTATIAEIQGTAAASPLVGKTVTTRGVVTAVYKTGGFNGAYIQTAGTGGTLDLAAHTASDGLFVFDSAFAAGVEKGQLVEVTGAVSEFNGLTELTTAAGKFKVLTEAAAPVAPAKVSFPLSETQRESLEGMLLLPQGDMTVTDNYATNQYAEIGINDGTKPLQTPTNVALPGAPAKAVLADNQQRLVVLDDGSSINFLTAVNQAIPLPWFRLGNEVRVGSAVTFVDPVVLDWRNSVWKLQPTQHLTADGKEPVTFSSTRTPTPAPVGGDVRIGTFNVLNYFPTTAADFVAAGLGTCTTYNDRDKNPITANTCSNNGPRGAADAANLARQQVKIVKAINTLDAGVVSLEEIENSKSVNPAANRDKALSTLVDALNADAKTDRWAFVPSPAQLPASEDVIRTAFIYQKKIVETVGQSSILVNSTAFGNARPPLAQAFKPVGGTSASTFAVIVNHFKSKGSSSLPQDADQGDLQGASNYSRKLQAADLVTFADSFGRSAGTDRVFLTGDFNAYDKEEPVQIIEAAGYTNVTAVKTDKETYQFDGMVGSLDHVFASPAAYQRVTGADVWNINAYEALAREYSRYNYNATILTDDSPYRASDHDPELIGFRAAPDGPVASSVAATVAGTTFGEAPSVSVTVTPGTAAGTVTVLEGDTELASGTVADGRATVVLPKTLTAGTHTLTVRYSGSTTVAASQTTASLVVAKATTTTVVDAPGSLRADARATVDTTVTSATGSVPTGTVTVTEGSKVRGTGSLVAGRLTIDAGTLAIGSHELAVAYAGDADHVASSATVVVQVLRATSGLAATATSGTYGTSSVLTVTGAPGSSGFVFVAAGDTAVGVGTLINGSATVTLSSTLPVGTTALTVFYAGNADFDPVSTTTSITVAKAATSLKKVSVVPTKIVKNRTKPFITLSVSGRGFTVDGGTVTVRASGKNYTGTVKAGKVRIRVGKFTSSGSKKKVTATFSGNGVANGSTTSFTVKVLKK